MKDLKECFKQHPTTHTVFGIGLGLLIAGLFWTSLGANAVAIGIIVALAALAYDYFFVK